MCAPEPSNSTTAVPEYYNIAEVQEKYLNSLLKYDTSLKENDIP